MAVFQIVKAQRMQGPLLASFGAEAGHPPGGLTLPETWSKLPDPRNDAPKLVAVGSG